VLDLELDARPSLRVARLHLGRRRAGFRRAKRRASSARKRARAHEAPSRLASGARRRASASRSAPARPRRRRAGRRQRAQSPPVKSCLCLSVAPMRAPALRPSRSAARIARAAAIDRQPRQRSQEIGRRRESLAQRVAQRRRLDEKGDSVEPFVDRPGSVNGLASRSAIQPRAGRRRRQVDGRDQRAGALAGQRAGQFEIGARRRVDLEPGATRARTGRSSRAARRSGCA